MGGEAISLRHSSGSCRLLLRLQARSHTLPGKRGRGRMGADMRASRQADRELGELAGNAVDFDRAAMLLGDDVVADRQAEAGALAGRLRREEGLEQFVTMFGRDPGAVVAHPDLDFVAEIAR